MRRLISQIFVGLIMVLYPMRSECGDVKLSATPVARIEWRLIKDEKAVIPDAIKADVQAIREHLKTFDLSQWLHQHFFPEKDSQYAHFNPGVGYKDYHAMMTDTHSGGFSFKSTNGTLRYFEKKHKFLGGFTPYYSFSGKSWFSGWKTEGYMFSDLIYPFEVKNHYIFIWRKIGVENPYNGTKNVAMIDRVSGAIVIDKVVDYWPGFDWGFSEFTTIGLPFCYKNKLYLQATLMKTYDDLKKPIEDRLSDIVVLELSGIE